MREELGKWLMDIAKYVVTAVLITSVFGSVEDWLVYLIGIIVVSVTLSIGLYLVKNKTSKK